MDRGGLSFLQILPSLHSLLVVHKWRAGKLLPSVLRVNRAVISVFLQKQDKKETILTTEKGNLILIFIIDFLLSDHVRQDKLHPYINGSCYMRYNRISLCWLILPKSGSDFWQCFNEFKG